MIRAGRFGFLDVRFAVSLFADRVSFDFGSIMSCCLRLVFLEKERELKKKSFHIFRWLSWLAAKLICIRRCWWWRLWWWLRCCCFCNDDDLVSFLSRGEVVLSFNGKTATLFFSRTSSFSFLSPAGLAHLCLLPHGGRRIATVRSSLCRAAAPAARRVLPLRAAAGSRRPRHRI